MTRILIAFSIFITFLFPSCGQTKDLTEEEIYSIINEIITDDSIQTASTICADFADLRWNSEFEKSFTKDDMKFSAAQDKKFASMKIKADKIKKYYWKIAVQKNISPYLNVDPNCNDTIHHTYFSFPVISADRQKVLIHMGSDGCFMCGGSGTYLYEKQNGRWKQIKYWDVIIV